MRSLTAKETRIMEMLRFGNLRGRDIGDHMGITQHQVSRIIANIRKKFMKGNANASYIFATKQGYTLEETPENLKQEGMMRLRMGTSAILNGKHVFNRCKQIDLTNYNALRIEFFPKAVSIVESLTKIEEEQCPELTVR